MLLVECRYEARKPFMTYASVTQLETRRRLLRSRRRRRLLTAVRGAAAA
jgi:hypothetical protein